MNFTVSYNEKDIKMQNLNDLPLRLQNKIRGMMPKKARIDGVEIFHKTKTAGRHERTQKFVNIYYSYNKMNCKTTTSAFVGSSVKYNY